MSGRRLLDLTKLVQATRVVAKNHAALRSDQWDKYNRTSTLARELKSQTDRVTLTAQAAIDLARRLSDFEDQEVNGFSPGTRNREHDRFQHGTLRNTTSKENQGPLQSNLANFQATAQSEEPTASSTAVNEKTVIPDATDKAGDEATLPTTNSSSSNATGHMRSHQIPKDVNLNVFRTKRVSKLLNVDRQQRDIPGGRAENTITSNGVQDGVDHINAKFPAAAADAPINEADDSVILNKKTYEMRQSRVPSTRIGRLWQYGGLATSMAIGAVGETLRRATNGSEGGSLILSPTNMERLVARLSRMRGAALKLGQMISFQDIKMLPQPILEVLQRVQDSADYMPPSQRDRVLANNLGSDWRGLFTQFDEVPVAAASIGQVHRAIYKPTGQEVAVKVQYPGVATSIDSDLNNLSILLTASRILPKGLFLDKTIANARTELAWECDYIREARCAKRYKELLSDDIDVFRVPDIIDDASGKEVLTAEFMGGTAVTRVPDMTQSERDWVGTHILRLCLREMCEFKFMQTDPNWTNFLWNHEENKIELLDFGASREYPDEFILPYIGVLRAASKSDRAMVRDLSVQLGYLTGTEGKKMTKAHVDSVMTLAEPFGETAPDVYDFKDQTITERVRELIPLMLKERMAPPPEETYSLHRKLSGAFLLCARLESRVRCKELFGKAMARLE